MSKALDYIKFDSSKLELQNKYKKILNDFESTIDYFKMINRDIGNKMTLNSGDFYVDQMLHGFSAIAASISYENELVSNVQLSNLIFNLNRNVDFVYPISGIIKTKSEINNMLITTNTILMSGSDIFRTKRDVIINNIELLEYNCIQNDDQYYLNLICNIKSVSNLNTIELYIHEYILCNILYKNIQEPIKCILKNRDEYSTICNCRLKLYNMDNLLLETALFNEQFNFIELSDLDLRGVDNILNISIPLRKKIDYIHNYFINVNCIPIENKFKTSTSIKTTNITENIDNIYNLFDKTNNIYRTYEIFLDNSKQIISGINKVSIYDISGNTNIIEHITTDPQGWYISCEQNPAITIFNKYQEGFILIDLNVCSLTQFNVITPIYFSNWSNLLVEFCYSTNEIIPLFGRNILATLCNTLRLHNQKLEEQIYSAFNLIRCYKYNTNYFEIAEIVPKIKYAIITGRTIWIPGKYVTIKTNLYVTQLYNFAYEICKNNYIDFLFITPYGEFFYEGQVS